MADATGAELADAEALATGRAPAVFTLQPSASKHSVEHDAIQRLARNSAFTRGF